MSAKSMIALAAAAVAAAVAAAAAADRPWLVVNEDNDHFFKLDSSRMTRKGLVEYVDSIAQGHVTHFFMCVSGQRASFDSKTVEPIWEGIGEPCGDGQPAGARRDHGQSGLWAVNAKRLFDAGIDPYEVWTARCRERGVSPWVSMRMNDVHFVTAVTNFFRNTRFARQRRDLWRVPDGSGWFDGALDYAHREVREYALAHLREIAARWDVDGVELDWMRCGLALRPNHERDDARLITDFMRRARAAVSEVGRRRGRPVKLSVRVPRTPSLSRNLGFDAVAWAREGLVDLVVATSLYKVDRDIDVRGWTDALAVANPAVAFLPCIDMVADFAAAEVSGRFMNAARYRYVADRFYAAGAKGIYLFNAPYVGRHDPTGLTNGGEDTFGTICAEGLSPAAIAGRPKEEVPPCRDFPPKGAPRNVPPLMETFGGSAVCTVAQWESARRPEILDRFLSEVYGRRPAEADRPPRVSFAAAAPDRLMLDGKALRKRVTCTYGGKYGYRSFTFTAFIPVRRKPAPAFLLICNRDPAANLDPERARKSEFWPVERLVERGYAAIAFFNGDVAPDVSWDFERGVFGVFQKPWERGADSWGVLSAWAWGASRVMDWIETEPLLDARRVGVVGHSRGGKTALLAGATDARFAMVCSNDSGCGGAKLNHIELPASEHIDQILESFGCWFCGNFEKYRCREFEMDFDQHMLAALVAPRLLAIASASEDDWAGQEGEFQSGLLASPAWELYGRRGLVAPGGRFPGVGKPLQDGGISYHMRRGIHDLTVYDWDRYMDFADRHGWN